MTLVVERDNCGNGDGEGDEEEPEARLWVNAGDSSGRMRSCVPDVGFVMDGDDEDCKQEAGFDFWWSERAGTALTETDLVDVVPFAIEVDSELVDGGGKVYLEVEGDAGLESLVVYKAISSGNNRRGYLQDARTARAQRQLAETTATLIPRGGEPVEIPFVRGGNNELLFKAIGSGSATAQLRLLVEKPDALGELVEQDWVRLNLKDSGSYWWFVSARGLWPSLSFDYPLDGGETDSVLVYPAPTTISGGHDPAKTKYLVYIHGLGATLETAREQNNLVFKRLYWLGYRGNYVGFAWEANETLGVPLPGPLGKVDFDRNVANAFRTAPSLMYFLGQLRAQVGAENVDVMAHSLGNMVMWEALRVHQAKFGSRLVHNAIGIAPAIWSEAFDPSSAVEYTGSYPVTYSVQNQKVHSWRFWFNQSEHRAIDSLKGHAYHSYNRRDYALVDTILSMQSNDWLWRALDPKIAISLIALLQGDFKLIPTLGLPMRHYNRDSYPAYMQRSPLGIGRHPLPQLPALLQQGRRTPWYPYRDLSPPAGAVRNPLANNYNAYFGGWTEKGHTDHYDLPLPHVYRWYKEFLADERAIAIGEE